MVRAPVDMNRARGRLTKTEQIMIRCDRRYSCSGHAVDQQIAGIHVRNRFAEQDLDWDQLANGGGSGRIVGGEKRRLFVDQSEQRGSNRDVRTVAVDVKQMHGQDVLACNKETCGIGQDVQSPTLS